MKPYLSFVVAARNDNYGGNFRGRLQVFVNALLAMWEKRSLDAELVIVEWNPPADRLRLREAIRWPNSPMLDRVSIVEVSNEVHSLFANSDRMPIFEYVAKNVGIRHAKGTFVLSTNPDILFSQSLVKFFSARKLNLDFYYRVNRHDVAEGIPAALSVDSQLRFCSLHSFRYHLAKRDVALNKPRRFFHHFSQAVPWFRPVRTLSRFLHANRVHTNASGDFMLMSADSWRSLRGYPELTTHSYIDSYLVYVAATSGLKQVVLPDPIYHPEHDRSEQTARPWTVLDKIPEFCEMIQKRRPHIANSENGGLADVNLPSFSICQDRTFKAMQACSAVSLTTQSS